MYSLYVFWANFLSHCKQCFKLIESNLTSTTPSTYASINNIILINENKGILMDRWSESVLNENSWIEKYNLCISMS